MTKIYEQDTILPKPLKEDSPTRWDLPIPQKPQRPVTASELPDIFEDEEEPLPSFPFDDEVKRPSFVRLKKYSDPRIPNLLLLLNPSTDDC